MLYPPNPNRFHSRSTSSPGLLSVDEPKSTSNSSSRRQPTSEEREHRAAREARRKERHERRQITQGQTKETTDKLGSRHADLIDTWDPTGLGSASECNSTVFIVSGLTFSVASVSLPPVNDF
jgi:hypothetical protein